MHADLPRNRGKNLMPAVQPHLEHRVREVLGNDALDLDSRFLLWLLVNLVGNRSTRGSTRAATTAGPRPGRTSATGPAAAGTTRRSITSTWSTCHRPKPTPRQCGHIGPIDSTHNQNDDFKVAPYPGRMAHNRQLYMTRKLAANARVNYINRSDSVDDQKTIVQPVMRKDTRRVTSVQLQAKLPTVFFVVPPATNGQTSAQFRIWNIKDNYPINLPTDPVPQVVEIQRLSNGSRIAIQTKTRWGTGQCPSDNTIDGIVGHHVSGMNGLDFRIQRRSTSGDCPQQFARGNHRQPILSRQQTGLGTFAGTWRPEKRNTHGSAGGAPPEHVVGIVRAHLDEAFVIPHRHLGLNPLDSLESHPNDNQ